ncbi:MAG: molybdopterin-dependent oxidoreductase [Tissierellia bacterium]|nr:molybdopterin-dependent oxidoreductase [Tissierellia bacterium]
MLKEMWKKEISRRKFLQASGLAATSLVLLKGYEKLTEDEVRVVNSPDAQTYIPEDVDKLYTSCYMCAINCGAVGVVNKDGTVKRIEPNKNDPVSGGALCAKGNAGIDQLYDEDRLKTPMRKIGEHEWEQISWDEAFDTMYDQFTRIASEHGPETVVGLNRRGYYTSYLKGWLRTYGSPNGPLGQASICDGGKRIAQQIAVGASGLYCDFKNSKYIMLLGANQFEAPRYRLGMIDDILTAQENGAKLIVIDPRFNYTASKADEFHPITPGTDGLFLLSMCHVIAKNGMEDSDFIANHSAGYEEFKNEILQDKYAPRNVEAEVGISADDIERMAIEFASAEGAIADTSSGLIMYQSGTVSDWALLNLVAMTGNMLNKGGIVKKAGAKTSGPKFEVDNSKDKEAFAKYLGYVSYEGGTENGNRNIIADCILNPEAVPTGPRVAEDTLSLYGGKGIKSIIVYNTEPIGAQSDSTRLKEAFNALEFGVVVDIYLSQTAEAMPVGSLALPECTYLERYSVRSANAYTPVLNINQPLTEPMWESKTGYWIFSKLGQRFGYEEFADFDPEDDLGQAIASVENADQ